MPHSPKIKSTWQCLLFSPTPRILAHYYNIPAPHLKFNMPELFSMLIHQNNASVILKLSQRNIIINWDKPSGGYQYHSHGVLQVNCRVLDEH